MARVVSSSRADGGKYAGVQIHFSAGRSMWDQWSNSRAAGSPKDFGLWPESQSIARTNPAGLRGAPAPVFRKGPFWEHRRPQ